MEIKSYRCQICGYVTTTPLVTTQVHNGKLIGRVLCADACCGGSAREIHPTVAPKVSMVIAGGRDYKFTQKDILWLDTLPIREVVSGGASGADAAGEDWARSRGIPVRRFPADWQTHGRAAGPIRNRQMAEYADAVVLFPGGRGTESMRREAERLGKRVYTPPD